MLNNLQIIVKDLEL